uniref:Uncharacterized protein n=1 Tax=Globodera rostochiensis TaxID=31243 RepID=A0A914HJG7_GLORO
MTSSINYGFFGLKIRNIHKMVEINLPTWKLPYFIYLENRKELEQENALDNIFGIICYDTLMEFKPTSTPKKNYNKLSLQ